ncbi:hypothetical protein TcCL_Unassigned05267, partial [Trypanosoma cruzi]
VGTARNPAGITAQHLSEDESERRHTDRTSATDCTAQAEATLMQLPHGVVRKASRNRVLSSALPQARVPPTNRRRCQEYDGLTASTPFECTYCEFRAQAKTGSPSRIRAHERSSTEPRSAPKKEAVHKCP